MIALDPLSPLERYGKSPAVLDALRTFRSPFMPPEAEFALLTRIGYGEKPYVYRSLADLARRIHRDRGRDALELLPAVVQFRGDQRKVTEVRAHDERSERTRRIGFAWHAGRPPEALKAALDHELMQQATALQMARAL